MQASGQVREAFDALTKKTVTIEVARSQLPKVGGLYAWWIVRSALAGVPANKHPTERDLDLLYIGIAPKGPASTATLHSRVVGNHMSGNIAASTFRRTLAALLIDELELTPLKKATKVTLPKEQNAKLSTWQQQHLRLTWHTVSKPWLHEQELITELRPPLNLAGNQAHSFHATLSTARQQLQQATRNG